MNVILTRVKIIKEKTMKLILRIIWIFVFVLFFGFALKNNQIVTLKFFWGYEQSSPLVILLLVFFIIGAAFCILAMLPTLFKMRLTISRNKKVIAEFEKEREISKETVSKPLVPDGIHNP